MKKRISKIPWLWIVFAVAVVITPIFVNWLMMMRCQITVEQNEWIAFWGAYLGAVGSFLMAIIAYKTLLQNNEQLKYIKEQNRPNLNVEIRKYIQQKTERDENGNLTNRLYHSHAYYLSIENHGNQIATNVHINVSIDVSDDISNKRMYPCLAGVNNLHFNLPANRKRNIILADIAFPSGLTTQQAEEQRSFIESIETGCFLVRITYDGVNRKYEYKEALYVRDAIVDSTTIVQMLDYIDNNIKDISQSLKTFMKHNS